MSNLPIKKRKTFLGKIKNFFRKLFFKDDNNMNIKDTMEIENEKNIYKDSNKSQFKESIKKEVKNDYINKMKREDFLNNIEKNLGMLYELPIEKLKILEKYYNESIKNQEEKLIKIKKIG